METQTIRQEAPGCEVRHVLPVHAKRDAIATGDRIAVAQSACNRGYTPEEVSALVVLTAGELVAWYRRKWAALERAR